MLKKNKFLVVISIFLLVLIVLNISFFPKYFYFLKSKILIPIVKFQNLKNSQELKNCFENNLTQESIDLKKNILIVGHAYGNSDEKNLGIYPKLIDYFNKKKHSFDLIIVAGDLVRVPSKNNYDLAINQLKKFGKDILIAPGNHDVGYSFLNEKREIFKNYFGQFYDFRIYKDNLILALDTNINSTIDKKQFNWLKNIVEKNDNINNIMVVTHQIPWRKEVENKILLDKHKKWELVKDKKNELIDFTNVVDFIKSRQKNTYFFAGSVNHKNYLYCFKKNNIAFINTGVGVNKINSIVLLKIEKNKIKLFNELF